MSQFEVMMLMGMGAITLALCYVGGAISDVRREVKEVWRRMPRID